MQPQGHKLQDSRNLKPQDSKVLKDLRDKLGMSQEKMAAALTEAFRQATGIKHYIQQPDVCRLENTAPNATHIDVFKLLAYSRLCNVEISQLLRPEYKKLLRDSGSDMRARAFQTDAEAEQCLLELEQHQRLIISPDFPSSFFRLDKQSGRYTQLNAPEYEAKELYTIDAFISFLFSPVNRYSLGRKKAILDDYLRYFQGNNFRQLNFFPRSVLPEHCQLTCIELLPEQKMLLIPGPITHYGKGDSFIEVRDQTIYRDVTRFYRRLHTLENSMIYLRIGLEALERMSDGSRARDAITFFALEILNTRDLNAVEAIKCFSPEIQTMIEQQDSSDGKPPTPDS